MGIAQAWADLCEYANVKFGESRVRLLLLCASLTSLELRPETPLHSPANALIHAHINVRVLCEAGWKVL